jgi:hypothetical protein
MTIARILPNFTDEPELVGELVELPYRRPSKTTVAKLLGTSDYIVTHTDGYVILRHSEYEVIGE